MPIKKKKISELNEAGDLKGFYTIGYRLLDGVKESVKIGLEYIQTAYEKVVQATKDAIAATTDMRQLEATVEDNEEARETAESRRTAAEQGRQTAESERSTAEGERNVSEELRVSAETQRSTAEDVRKAAELLRLEAETERSIAEQNRKTAESGRATAEQARATEYAGIKTESEDVIAAHRSAVASANQAAIYANREGDIAKEKAALADAAAQAANTAATTIDDKMQTAINKLIAGAPDALDTLNELAASLGNDPNFATTIATELGKKLNKTDIINDVVTGGVDKVLSAQQGVELAGQIVEMGKNAGGKMVLIPSAVLNLTNASTSNEILDAFGSKEAFIDIVTKVKEGAPAAINANGISIILSACNGTVVESNNQYILNFILINPIDTAANFIMAITLTGDIATIDKQSYSYGYANIVNIPIEIMSLRTDSTSEQIISVFGGRENFDNIVFKVRQNGVIAVMTGSVDVNTGGFPVAIAVNSYINSNNLDLAFTIQMGIDIVSLIVEVTNGVFKLLKYTTSLLESDNLISDPSTGGTDRPASAEAVKVLNDNKIGKGDNAASATKLKDTRLIFGQPYDGSADTNGTLLVKPTGNSYSEGIRIQSPNNSEWSNIQFGTDSSQNGYINGQWLIGRNPSKAFVVTPAGSEQVGLIQQKGFSVDYEKGDTYMGLNRDLYFTAETTSNSGIHFTMGDNDYARIMVAGGANNGVLEIATADDGTEPIYVRQYTGVFTSLVRTATLLDGSGNTYFPGSVHAPSGFWKDSDARLKSHITPLRHTLDQILAIPTAGFVMDGKQQIGTIAQEVEKICPEVVSESFELKSQVPERDDWEVFVENDHEGNSQEYVKVKRVEYEMLGVLTLEGVKLLAKEVEELRNRLKELER